MQQDNLIVATDQHPAIAGASQRVVKLYATLGEGLKHQQIWSNFPGWTRLCNIPAGEIRGGCNFEDDAIIVAGKVVYRVTNQGVYT